MTKERKILLALLVVAAGALLIDRFVLSDKAVGSTAANTAKASTPAGRTNSQTNRATPRQRQQQPQTDVEQGYRPLTLQVLTGRSGVSGQAERNVFVYYVPPPPPVKPQPPPPPPPLAIYSLDPRSVYAKTKDFTVTVKGTKLPDDAQIVVSGRPLKTNRVSDAELNATVDKRMIATAIPLQVMVRNLTGELYSNQLTLTVQEPEAPRYRYLGRIDDVAFLLRSDNERIVARLNGKLVDDRWLVMQVSAENVVLKDVTLDILHTLPIEESETGSSGQVGGVVNPNQGNFNRGRTQRGNVKGAIDAQPAEPVSVEDEEPR